MEHTTVSMGYSCALKVAQRTCCNFKRAKNPAILLILVFILASTYSMGQYRRTVRLKGDTISSRGSSQGTGNGILAYFASSDTVSLGYFTVGRGNETEQVFGDMPVSGWTSQYIKKKKFSSEKMGPSYRWIIRSLSASSDTLDAVLFTHIRAEILRSGTENGRYGLVASVDTVLSFSRTDSLDFEKALSGTMDLLYNISMASGEAQGAQKVFLDKQHSVAVQNFTDRSIDSLSKTLHVSYRILSDTVYTKGIYRTFTEFLNNAPSVTSPVWIMPDTVSGNGYARLYTMGSDSVEVEVKNAWGICLGGSEVYKLESGRLLAIEKDGEGFALARYLDYRTRRNNAMAWRLSMGTAWPNDNNPYERKRSETLHSFRGRAFSGRESPVATRLDLSSGELMF